MPNWNFLHSRNLLLLGLVVAMATWTGCGGDAQEKKDASTNDNAPAAAEAGDDNAADPSANDGAAAQPAARPVTITPPKPMSPIDPNTLGPKNDIDLSLLPSDGFATVVIHPQRIMADPTAGPQLAQLLTTFVGDDLSYLGVDPATVTQIISTSQMSRGSTTGVVLRQVTAMQLNAPIDGAPLIETFIFQVTGGVHKIKKASIDGREYFVSDGPTVDPFGAPIPHAGGYQRDDRTILLFQGPVVEQIVRGQQATGHLAERLSHCDLDNDLMMLVSFESDEKMGPDYAEDIRASLLHGYGEATADQFAPMIELLGKARAAELSVDLQSDPIAGLNVHMVDDESSSKLEQFANMYLGLAGQLLPSVAASPELDESYRSIAQLGVEAVQGLSIQRNASDVGVTLRRPASYGQVIPRLLDEVVAQLQVQAEQNRAVTDMRTLTLAMCEYQTQNKSFHPPAIVDAQGRPLLSWRVAMLPYLGEHQLYSQFKLDEPWDSPHNKALVEKMPEVFASKNSPPGLTRYLIFTGQGTPLSAKNLSPFLPALRQKLAVVQVGPDKAVPWTAPMDVPYNPQTLLASLGDLGPDQALLGVEFSLSGRMLTLNGAPPAVLATYITLSQDELTPPPAPMMRSSLPAAGASVAAPPADPFNVPPSGTQPTMGPQPGYGTPPSSNNDAASPIPVRPTTPPTSGVPNPLRP